MNKALDVKTASVVIIGGGISGVSIAYNLAKKGVKDVVVIERDYLTSGSTGRCGAGVRMQWGTEMNCQYAKYSIDFYEKANEELEYEYDIEFKQGGYLIVASTEKEESRAPQEAGHPVKNAYTQGSQGSNPLYG